MPSPVASRASDPIVSSSFPAGLEAHLARLSERAGESFSSEAQMRTWLADCGVNLEVADRIKGLSKLFHKIEHGEAKLVYDERDRRVFRVASAAKIDVMVTLQGERYPLIELCQIFLATKIDSEKLLVTDPARVANVLGSLNIRSCQVRDSQQLWETLIGSEEPLIGTRRGVQEELGLTEEQAALAHITLQGSSLEYEAPLDWPGIHSVLAIYSATAVLPESISKPVYAELEANDQLSIFITTPGEPVIQGLLKQIIPNINYTKPTI